MEYLTKINDTGKEFLSDSLADAVAYGHDNSDEGNSISIYETVQDSFGEPIPLHKVLSFVKLREIT